MVDNLPLAIAACCREWPVLLGAYIGKCGYCKTKPVIVRVG